MTERSGGGGGRERAQRLVLAASALAMAATGLWMMVDPPGWFAATPGVAETGPMNTHFVRDVGAAFLTFSIGLLFAIPPLPARFALAAVAAVFAVLHALIHLYEAFGSAGRPIQPAEGAAIFGAAAVATIVAVWVYPRRARSGA
jgi:hypothetical protein